MKTIDIAPTWKALMPVMFAILENGSENGKRKVRSDLMRLAVLLDFRNAADAGGK